MPWGAAALVGGALIGANATKKAAAAQQSAANDANQLQWNMYQQGREDSAPWRQAGGQGLSALLYGLGIGNSAGYGQPGYDGQQFRAGGAAPPTDGARPINYLKSDGDQMVRAATAPMRTNAGNEGDLFSVRAPIQSTAPQQFSPYTSMAPDSRQEFGNLLRDFRMSDYTEDPGYQFRLQQGESAINRNALAKGRYNSGSVLKALQDFNSGLASQEFQSSYNRFRGQQGDRYNRLAALAGVGQTQTNLDNQNRMATAGQIGGNMIGAGNAAAAGRVGQANALMGAINNGINWYQGQQAINALKNNGYNQVY